MLPSKFSQFISSIKTFFKKFLSFIMVSFYFLQNICKNGLLLLKCILFLYQRSYINLIRKEKKFTLALCENIIFDV